MAPVGEGENFRLTRSYDDARSPRD